MVFASYPFNLNNINMRSDIYLQTRQYDGHRSIFRNGWIGPTICTNTILRFIHPILFKISRKKIIIAIFNYCAACYCKMLRGFQYPTILQPIESIEDKKSQNHYFKTFSRLGDPVYLAASWPSKCFSPCYLLAVVYQAGQNPVWKESPPPLLNSSYFQLDYWVLACQQQQVVASQLATTTTTSPYYYWQQQLLRPEKIKGGGGGIPKMKKKPVVVTF